MPHTRTLEERPGKVLAAFSVAGHAVGCYTQGARPNRKRLMAYHAYRDVVLWSAKAAGIRLPLTATEERPLRIVTALHASSRVHHDPENVHKGIVDALLYLAPGGDKHVGGCFEPATYGEEARVDVRIEVYR